MTPDVTAMTFTEADQYAREQIDAHRDAMAWWRHARAQRVLDEYRAGRGIADLARDAGVSPQNFYAMLDELRERPEPPRGRCPVCTKNITLTPDGRMRPHGYRGGCQGSGQQPNDN